MARPATAATTATESSAAGEIPGCVPECSSGFLDPGTMRVGPHQTRNFLNGQLTVTFSEPWESHEDQGVEFSAAPVGRWDIHRVLFWSDIQPVGFHGEPVAGVPQTAAGMLAWFSTRPDLKVSKPWAVTIGVDKLPATAIDIDIDVDAANEDPDCPATACAAIVTWPNAGSNFYAIGTPSVVRLYLADISYGGQAHLLAVAIEGKDPADLSAWLPTAEALIATASAPVSPG